MSSSQKEKDMSSSQEKKGMKSIFKGVVMCVVGEHHGNLPQWVTLRAGKFVQEMDDSVTHLICTPQEYKKKGDKVKHALKLKKTCSIVTHDWLSSCMPNSLQLRLDHREPVKEYLLQNYQKAETVELAKVKQVAKNNELEVRYINRNGYRIYADRLNFFYEFTITRTDSDGVDHGERYTLQFFESIDNPPLYWFGAKYLRRKGDPNPSYHRPSASPRQFAVEFKEFKNFFQIKTGIDWDERIALAGTTDKQHFQYQPPTGGKPVGVVVGKYADFEYPPTPPTECQKTVIGDAVGSNSADTDMADDSETTGDVDMADDSEATGDVDMADNDATTVGLLPRETSVDLVGDEGASDVETRPTVRTFDPRLRGLNSTLDFSSLQSMFEPIEQAIFYEYDALLAPFESPSIDLSKKAVRRAIYLVRQRKKHMTAVFNARANAHTNFTNSLNATHTDTDFASLANTTSTNAANNVNIPNTTNVTNANITPPNNQAISPLARAIARARAVQPAGPQGVYMDTSAANRTITFFTLP